MRPDPSPAPTAPGAAPAPDAAPPRPDPALLLVALAPPLAWGLLAGPRWLEPRLGELPTALLGMAVLWASALVAVALARGGLAALGGRRPTRRGVLLGLGAGLVLMLLVPLLSLLAGWLLPAPAEGGVLEAAARPAWLLGLGVLTAAATEEVLFRAAPVAALPGRPWAGALLGLAAFTLLHAPGWPVAHVLGVVLPLGAALAALYLWRRDLLTVVLAHLVVDLPLVVLALLGAGG